MTQLVLIHHRIIITHFRILITSIMQTTIISRILTVIVIVYILVLFPEIFNQPLLLGYFLSADDLFGLGGLDKGVWAGEFLFDLGLCGAVE